MACCRLFRITVLSALSLLSVSATALETAPRIIGGQDASHEWPWAALIQIDNDPDDQTAGYCSGMALTDQLVVTAAHCFFDQNDRLVTDPATLTVRVGSTPILMPMTSMAGKSVSAFELPASQNDAQAFSNDGEDIALLRLATPVNLSRFPSLVDEAHYDQLQGLDHSQRDEALTVIGWGVTTPGSNSISSTLQEAQLDYVPFQQCDTDWSSHQLIEKQMLCADELNPIAGQRQDTCQGDSGGPLFLSQDPAPYVVGLTSFGATECGDARPAVYTDVFHQIAFIEDASLTLGQPLIDIGISADQERYYTPAGTSLALEGILANHSLSNTANNPSYSYTGNHLSVTDTANGCPENTACPLASPMNSGQDHDLEFAVESDLQGQPQSQGTLTLTATADESDYRINNNQHEVTVVFSEQPDLTVSARMVTAETNGHYGTATIEVTVKNLSTVPDATADLITLDLTLPDNTAIITSHNDIECQGHHCMLPGSLGPEKETQARFDLSTPDPKESTFEVTVSAQNGDFPTDNNTASVTFDYADLTNQTTSSSGGGALAWLIVLIGLTALRRGAGRGRVES